MKNLESIQSLPNNKLTSRKLKKRHSHTMWIKNMILELIIDTGIDTGYQYLKYEIL